MKNATESKGKNYIKINLILSAAAITVAATEVANRFNSSSKDSQAERIIKEMVSGERSLDPQICREMGSEEIQPLLKALARQDSAAERAYVLFRSVLPECLSGHLPELTRSQMIRLNAAGLIGYLGPAAKPAVPKLINLLKDEAADVNAAHSLGLIGPDAQAAVPALILAVEEHRPFAATALESEILFLMFS
jgi:hypothetical protein